jgi:HAD superfamily hydrolase (TIGR01450 family)
MHSSKIMISGSGGIFARYELIRRRLPSADFPDYTRVIQSYEEIADDFDVFLFDAFGVMNIGDEAVEGCAEVFEMLRSMGKYPYVLTNGSSLSKRDILNRFAKLGYRMDAGFVSTGRDLLTDAAAGTGMTIGIISGQRDVSDMGIENYVFHGDAGFYDADMYMFLDSVGWDGEKQEEWMKNLQSSPRPVWVGNPDLSAPRDGAFSAEPGYFTLDAGDEVFRMMKFFGKPFGGIYSHAFDNIRKNTGITDKSRMLMIGDTLHTDILGGAAAGIRTLLVTPYGFFAGLDASLFIEVSGIRPDYIL